jgi:hypothetical protein
MEEKAGSAALGRLILLIARDEGIQKALAQLGEIEAAKVNLGAVAALKRFLEDQTSRAGAPPATLPPKPDLLRKPPAPAVPLPPLKPAAPLVASTVPTETARPKAQEQPVVPVKSLPPITPPVLREPVKPPSPAPPVAPPRSSQPAEPLKPVQPSETIEVPRPSPPMVASFKAEPVPAPPVVEIPASVSAPVEFPAVREPFPFEDQQSYVYGVSLIPLSDSPSPTPFFLDEKGLDQRTRVFAVDHAGMRFFMSELYADVFNVSKNGVLLLNRADSLRLRGVHERIVNQLRLYGALLPAEFGTAVLGRGDFSRRVEFRLHALLEFVLELARTTIWSVTVSVLDDRVQQLLGTEPAPQRSVRQEPERGRQGATTKRIDVKSLERLLTREKKIAEAILNSLALFAESHKVEQMVNLGSGRSEEWKSILRAQFSLPSGRSQRFFRACVDIEADHAMIEPSIRVAGSTESFSLLM